MDLRATVALGAFLLSSAAPPLPGLCGAALGGDVQDCGAVGTTASQCAADGCCWNDAPEDPSQPWCYHAADFGAGYAFDNATHASLADAGTGYFGDDVNSVSFSVTEETDTRLRVRITDADAVRWEIPESIIPLNKDPPTTKDPLYAFSQAAAGEAVGFAVSRAGAEGPALFNASGLVFKDQFISLTTALPFGHALYGMGERTNSAGMRLSPGENYTLWNADKPSLVADVNLYGSHPLYLDVRPDGTSHGVLLFNSNGMDVQLEEGSLTYRAIGGVLDLYFFLGPTPEDVVAQYTQLVGLPAMPPYWSLGWHQCKYGYPSIAHVAEVVANYSAAGIPLDVAWSDIDYMDQYHDFSFDPVNYATADVAAFADDLHSRGQKYVVIVDPGIPLVDGYRPYADGVDANLFVKNAPEVDSDDYMGSVWPGPVVFPDFTHPDAGEYWQNQISNFSTETGVAVDGLWIDMNEPSNACYGYCHAPSGGLQLSCDLDCADPESSGSSFDSPPYRINNGAHHDPLGSMTVAAGALHHGDVRAYNLHNMYGLTEAIATHDALVQTGKERPFVLSRSTFVSSGKHTFHWTGDNAATWDDLLWSIRGILNSNLFGMPMVGADICGFIDDTTEELCARWTALGAFYPFSRNHADVNSVDQEPYRWPTTTTAARASISMRYAILPYLNTLFYNAHAFGGTVARPLFFEFPTDPKCLDIDAQFMLGPDVLVSPVLEQGATSVDAYFPAGTWYALTGYGPPVVAGNATVTIPNAVGDAPPVHVRAGGVVPMHTGSPHTTKEARATPFSILAALPDDRAGLATGTLFLDDGVQVDPVNGKASVVEITVSADGWAELDVDGDYTDGALVTELRVFGIEFGVTSVSCGLAGIEVPCEMEYDIGTVSLTVTAASGWSRVEWK